LALVALARRHNPAGALLRVEAEFGLAGALVGTVALEAVRRKDRQYVSAEGDRAVAAAGGTEREEGEKRVPTAVQHRGESAGSPRLPLSSPVGPSINTHSPCRIANRPEAA